MSEVNYDELVEIEKLLSADGYSIKDFLVELLLTDQWDIKYETLFMWDKRLYTFADLMIRLGFIQTDDKMRGQFTYSNYEVTDKGRKYIEQ